MISYIGKKATKLLVILSTAVTGVGGFSIIIKYIITIIAYDFIQLLQQSKPTRGDNVKK